MWRLIRCAVEISSAHSREWACSDVMPHLFRVIYLVQYEMLAVPLQEGNGTVARCVPFIFAQVLLSRYTRATPDQFCSKHETSVRAAGVAGRRDFSLRMLSLLIENSFEHRITPYETLFGHVRAQVLRPLGKFATDDATAAYPSITAGDMMQEELKAINLAA